MIANITTLMIVEALVGLGIALLASFGAGVALGMYLARRR